MTVGTLMMLLVMAVGVFGSPLPQLTIPPERGVKIVAYECPGFSDPRIGGFSMEVWRLLQGRILRGEEWSVEDIVWMTEAEAFNATRHSLFDVLLGCTAITKENSDLSLSTPIFETALGFMVKQPPSTTSELTALFTIFARYCTLLLVIILTFGYIIHYIFGITDSLSSSMWLAGRSVLLLTTDEIRQGPMMANSVWKTASFYFLSYVSCLSGVLVICMCTASMSSEITDSMTVISHPSDLSGKAVGCIGERALQYGKDIGARVATAGVWDILKNDGVEAVIADIPTLVLREQHQNSGVDQFYIHPMRVRPYGVGIAFRKDSPLCDLINPGIIEWRDEGNTVGYDGGVDTLTHRYFGDLTSTYSPVRYHDDNTVFIVCGVLSGVQLLIWVVIFVYNRKSTSSLPKSVKSNIRFEALHSISLLTTLLHKGVDSDDALRSAVLSSLDKLRSELRAVTVPSQVGYPNRVFPDHSASTLDKDQIYATHADFNEF